VKSTKLKMMTATVGAGALLAVGVLSVAFSESTSADPAVPGPVVPGEATIGETTTTTTVPTEPETPSATPPVTATTPEGFATP
jgi:hypothetical protein